MKQREPTVADFKISPLFFEKIRKTFKHKETSSALSVYIFAF